MKQQLYRHLQQFIEMKPHFYYSIYLLHRYCDANLSLSSSRKCIGNILVKTVFKQQLIL